MSHSMLTGNFLTHRGQCVHQLSRGSIPGQQRTGIVYRLYRWVLPRLIGHHSLLVSLSFGSVFPNRGKRVYRMSEWYVPEQYWPELVYPLRPWLLPSIE